MKTSKAADTRKIQHMPVEIFLSDGKRIAGYLDYKGAVDKAPPKCAFIIIPPAFGETKRDALFISYYLVSNGFNVFRYDTVNHIGESDGDIFDYRMSRDIDCLRQICGYISKTYGAHDMGIVAKSLAARMSIKASTVIPDIKYIVSMVGVVDLQKTLCEILQEDVVGHAIQKKTELSYNVMGFEVDAAFLYDVVEADLYDLKSSIDDISRSDISLSFYYGDKDPWVSNEDMNYIGIIFEESGRLQFRRYDDTMHHFYENMTLAKTMLSSMVCDAIKYTFDAAIEQDAVRAPSMRQIAAQNKREKEQMRKGVLTKKEERDFWSAYMNRYSVVSCSDDYIRFLHDIYETLGRIRDNDIILDTGCGNGHFGSFIINRLSLDAEKRSDLLLLPFYMYVGYDFATGALKEAFWSHSQLLADSSADKKPVTGGVLVDSRKHFYMHGDLDSGRPEEFTPFENSCFDKICCSLILSYLREPLHLVKELFRLVKPGGTIAVTSLKPYADLSLLYKHFVTQGHGEDRIEEAKKFLNQAGVIKMKEGMGHYTFFSDSELKAMLKSAGFTVEESCLSLGGQACIVGGRKL